MVEDSQKRAARPSKAPQTKIEEYRTAIRTWVMKQGFTVHGIALAADLSPGTCRDMFADTWNPRFKTLLALERFIRRYTVELKEQAKQQSEDEVNLPSL